VDRTFFQVEKLFELRVARQDLARVSQIYDTSGKTSTASYRQIDQSAKRACRRFDAVWFMKCEQVEDDARVRFFGPGQKALLVFFD